MLDVSILLAVLWTYACKLQRI